MIGGKPMNGPAPRRYTGDLVNLDIGRISRDVFTNQAIYDDEMERIFARSWQFIGHESQVAENGDYVLSRMGEVFSRQGPVPL